MRFYCTLAVLSLATNGVFLTAQETKDESAATPATPQPPKTVAAGAELVELYGDDRFFEGPTWEPVGKKLYFTAFGPGNQQVLRLEEPGKVTVWKDQSKGVNGTFLSIEGRLLGAQAYGQSVVDYGFNEDGTCEEKTLFYYAPLNQPNDVCQTRDGDIFYTDPGPKIPVGAYRLTKRGEIVKFAEELTTPNGIIASNDGLTVYVGDSSQKNWRSYAVLPRGMMGVGSVFFSPDPKYKSDADGAPDGMTIDAEGNLYLSGGSRVWVVTPTGHSLGVISTPSFCSNVTFGGEDGKTLFLTCNKKVYSLQMNVAGGAGASGK